MGQKRTANLAGVHSRLRLASQLLYYPPSNDTHTYRYEEVEPTTHCGVMAASKIHAPPLTSLKRLNLVRIIAVVAIFSSIFHTFGAHTVNVAWNASTDSTVVGYKVYYGTSQTTLATGSSVDVGANLNASIANLGSGTYYFGATSYTSNRVESDLSNITSTNLLDAPVIVAQSASATCMYGATTNLAVTVSGTAPFSYKWYSNNVAMIDSGNVAGSATASLTFNNAVDANQGSYKVVVTNSIGGATSSVMTLTVLDPPGITAQPASLTRNAGASAIFSVSVNGAPPFSYQWSKNGAPLADGGNILGSATTALTVGPVAASDAASYQCIVANSSGNVTSVVATLTVIIPPGINGQPASQTLNAGATANFSVSATGTTPLTYAWKKNGSALANGGNVSGVSSANLTVGNLSATDSGSYTVVISNSGGNATSSSATLVVISPPTFTSQPSNVTTNAGSSTTFGVVAQGSGSLSFQWLKNGAPLTSGGNISGSTTAALNLSNLASGDAGSYQCVVTNAAGSVTSTAATLTVIVPPGVSSQPISQTLNAGALAVFNVTATGTAPLTYSWLKNGSQLSNGGKIAGATTAALSITNLTATEAGSYSVVITNIGGSVTSLSATLVVIGPPTITSQPLTVTTNEGSAATFTVVAQGSGPLSFQWLKNGAPLANGGNISGATTAALNLIGLASGDAGSFQCVVTNSAGSVTSLVATLTVVVPPGISGQPASQIVNAGALTVFSITATGTAPLSYAWLKNGSTIVNGGSFSGATTASLTITNVAGTNAGSYSAIVTNSAGRATSASAVLTVITPPGFSSQPASATANAGALVLLSVTAQGTQPINYQWIKNGSPVSDGGNVFGTTAATLTISSATANDAGSYKCIATNSAGSATSSLATVTVIVPPNIATQPLSQTLNAGTLTVFNITATGTAPLSYSWLKNGSAIVSGGKISGATSSSLTIASVAAADVGSYSAIVTNSAGTATSASAVLTVITPPSLSSQPASVTVNAGASAGFTINAQGTAPIGYQWFKNGAPLSDIGNISGSTATTLNLLNVASSDAGSYKCVITNAAGSVTSTAATLTVIVPPGLNSQPTSQTLNAGALAVFNVTATGTAPLTFAWLKNGSPLANGGKITGATSSSLSVSSLTATEAGSYSIVVTNIGGSVTSAAATLVVIAPPAITSQPANVTTNEGSAATFTVVAQGSGSLGYQWLKNGTPLTDSDNILGSIASTLNLLNVASNDAASYQCVVTNAAGNVTSTSVTLTVVVPAAISSQPASQTLNAGTVAVFNFTATGTAPLNYSWLKNGITLANGGKISGATTGSLTIMNLAGTDAGSYSALVTNIGGSATSASAFLTVIIPPSITTQPSNVTTNAGATASFTITADGPAPLIYQWLKNGSPITDGGNISGSSTATLNVLSVASGDAGSYQCVVSNSAGSVTGFVATLTVIVPPGISSQPVSQTLNAGGIAVFNITATGTSPMSYSWLKNGGTIVSGGNFSGATSGSLTISSVADTDAGSYSAIVTNAAGSATSASAVLTVITPPSFSSQPASVTTNAGSLVLLSVTAQGTQPITFQWIKNGSPVASSGTVFGAATAALTISSAAGSDAGSYQCIVTNSAGSVTSSLAIVNVILPPSITSQPTTRTSYVGATTIFNVSVTGTAPFVYSWMKNGALLGNGGNVSGATGASLTLNGIGHADAGSYSCVITNTADSVSSSAALLTVSDASAILTQPTNQTLNACDTLSLTVLVGGSTTPAYQWMHNGSIVPGATNATLSVAGITRLDAGTYNVQVSGDSVLNSSNAVVTIVDPVFLTEPSDNCVSVNGTNVFIAQACGANLSYQWYFASSGSATATSIDGETNFSLSVGPVSSKNIGQYFCIVTNESGSITSRVASLGVEVAPSITSQPANQVKMVGNTVTFAVGATANSQMTFQWARNGTNISGATDSAYTIATVQTSDAGTYQCYVGTVLCQSTVLSSAKSGHLTITRDLVRPNVTFSYPTINARFTNSFTAHFGIVTSTAPQIVISGTATDNSRVAGLTITRTWPPTAPMKFVPTLVGALNSERWTNAVSLVAGTNTFMAIVTDAAGWSSTNLLNVFLRVPSTLHVNTTGAGSTSALPPSTFGAATNNAILEIGRNYGISAKPAAGNVFSNWVDGTGAEISGNSTLLFRMVDSLSLVANFVTNPIIANNASGSYNGLFYETNKVRIKSAGAIFNLLVRPDTTFSGTLKVDGATYTLSGTFDVHGNATKNIQRSGKTALTVALHLDFVAKQISGTITSPEPDVWTSVLMADIAPYSNANHFPDSARYTMAIPPGDGAPTHSPGGFGFGFVTNNPLGLISLIGTLSDGTPVSQTVPISQQGYWPLYIPLYGNRGLIEGWVNFSSGSPRGNVSWIRPAGALTSSYTNGFTNIGTIFGSPYTPMTPSYDPGDAALDVGLPRLTFPYAVSNNNAIVELPGGPTNYLAGSISAANGAVTISYRPTGSQANLTGHAAVLQWNNGAYGYVLSNKVSLPLHLH